MKPMMLIAMMLGVVTFAYLGVSGTDWMTAAEPGPNSVMPRGIPLPPIAVSIAMVGGIVLLITGRNNE